MQHAVKAALHWQLGRVKQVYLLSLSEEELCDRESFDQMHESMAARALPSVVGCAAEEVLAGGAWLSKARQSGSMRARLRLARKPK